MIGGKAWTYNHVFTWLLKVPSVGAARIAGGRLFQRRGATAEKALFRVRSFRAFLSVRLLSLTSWLEQVIRADHHEDDDDWNVQYWFLQGWGMALSTAGGEQPIDKLENIHSASSVLILFLLKISKASAPVGM